jgi:outer membrane biosynthesis protein TonB
MLAFGSRSETATLFSICAIVFSYIIFWKVRNYSIAFVIFVGFLLGQTFTTTPTVQASTVLVAINKTVAETKSPQPAQSAETKSPQPAQSAETKSPQPAQSAETKSPQPTQSAETKSPQPTQSAETESPQPTQSAETESPQPQMNSQLSKQCEFEYQVLTEKNDKFVCISTKQYVVIARNPIEKARSQARTTQNLEYKRNVNRIEASSALPESSCAFNFSGTLQLLSCNIVELPYRLPSFLFRPFPVIDSGSSFQNLAGLENILWLFLISLGVLRVIRKWKFQENRLIISFLFSYLICFSSAAALYEGNLGTAFRHKSTILWSILLVIILTKDSKIPRIKELPAFHK